ncbi:MAG: Crp/Fnr family transcriptional regulator [bacterium]|nr:MAG: Crp/Fnr family transcriptional regulator [bacterium]
MDLTKKDELLKQFPLFSGLEEEHLSTLAAIAVPKRIPKKSVLFREGEEARGFYLLLKGRIKLSKVSPIGKEQILHFVQKGQSFAEAALYMNRTYPATAEALEESDLFFIPREGLSSAMSSDPGLAMNLIAHLARYLQMLTRKVEELSLMDATSRLAQHLIGNMDKVTGLVRLGAGKGQTASSLGMAVETFSRTLTKFKEEGLVKEASPGVIQVLDAEKLRNFSA